MPGRPTFCSDRPPFCPPARLGLPACPPSTLLAVAVPWHATGYAQRRLSSQRRNICDTCPAGRRNKVTPPPRPSQARVGEIMRHVTADGRLPPPEAAAAHEPPLQPGPRPEPRSATADGGTARSSSEDSGVGVGRTGYAAHWMVRGALWRGSMGKRRPWQCPTGHCASSRCAWRLWVPSLSGGEAGPLGAPPLPWILEQSAPKAADSTACYRPQLADS